MRATLEIPGPLALAQAREALVAHHYLRTAPDPRTRPFGYVVRVAGAPAGCLFFGRPESTCCYRGELTYGSRGDVMSGRARFDRWEVLNLARVWLSPDVQSGGRLCDPDFVPGFFDRKGTWRPTLASWAVGEALRRVGFDYLMAHPPCFVEEPYAIQAVLSYCDRRRHRGTLYRAAGFALARTNAEGVETWWTGDVAPLSAEQDRQVRHRAATDPRSRRIRARAIPKGAD